MIDVREPENPRRVGGRFVGTFIDDQPQGLALAPGLVYVGSLKGLTILDRFREFGLRLDRNLTKVMVQGPRGVPVRVEATEDFESWQNMGEATLELETEMLLPASEKSKTFYRARLQ